VGGWVISAPLPLALCVRFQRLIEDGLSGRASALRLKLSPATGARWARQVRTRGNSAPAPRGRPRGQGKLAPHRAFLEELVAQDPDITLFQLRDALAEAEGVQGARQVAAIRAAALDGQLCIAKLVAEPLRFVHSQVVCVQERMAQRQWSSYTCNLS